MDKLEDIYNQSHRDEIKKLNGKWFSKLNSPWTNFICKRRATQLKTNYIVDLRHDSISCKAMYEFVEVSNRIQDQKFKLKYTTNDKICVMKIDWSNES
jgi:hypothetical protein